MKRFLKTKHQSHHGQDPIVDEYSKGRVHFLARLMVVFFAVILLFVPVILFLISDMGRAVMAVVVLAFVSMFSISISLLTDAQLPEIFIGTATYCAVLVTFLGNLGGARHGCDTES